MLSITLDNISDITSLAVFRPVENSLISSGEHLENSLEELVNTLVENLSVVILGLLEAGDLRDSFPGRPCWLQNMTDSGFGDPGVLLIIGGGPSKDLLLGTRLGIGTAGSSEVLE